MSRLKASVNHLVELNKKVLFDCLDSLDGTKAIVWDRSLMQRVNLFAGPSALSTHGVVSNSALDQCRPSEAQHVLFFISPTIAAVEALCAYMNKVANEGSCNYVYFIPEIWFVARERLKENEEIYSRIESVRSLPLSWLPSGEVVSLFLPQLPSRILLNGDWTFLHKCASALVQLDSSCERSLSLFASGKWAKDIANMMHRMTQQDSVPSSLPRNLRLSRLVIIDRWADPLTPLLTQLTYGGLIDEVYGIGISQSIKVSEAEFSEVDNADPFAHKEIHLTDELFDRLRHAHINAIGQEMATIIAEIREDEKCDREKMSVAEYQILVKKMPQILKRRGWASLHMRLAEMVKQKLFDDLSDSVNAQKELIESCDGDKIFPFIEDRIIDAAPLNEVLRLVAIQSICGNGLKPSVLHQYERMISQSYGIDGLNLCLKMRKLGLIRERGGAKMTSQYPPLQFTQMKKSYQLTNEADEMFQADPGYAYSGYSPLLVRMIDEGEKSKWAGWYSIPGNTIEEENGTAVFVVGGLTRAELSCLRLLPTISLVATSDVTNGNRLIDSITNIVE